MFRWLFGLKPKEDKAVALPAGRPSNYPPPTQKIVPPQGGSGTAPTKSIYPGLRSTPTPSSPPTPCDNTLTTLLLAHTIMSSSPPPPPAPSNDAPTSSYDGGYSSGAGDFSSDVGCGGSTGGDF